MTLMQGHYVNLFYYSWILTMGNLKTEYDVKPEYNRQQLPRIKTNLQTISVKCFIGKAVQITLLQNEVAIL